MKHLLILICSLLIFVTSSGAVTSELEGVLVAPQGEVRAGQSLTITVYYNNPGDVAVQTNAVFKPISCLVSVKGKQTEVMAEPEMLPADKTVIIPGNGFKKVVYRFTLPADLYGNVTIALVGKTANNAVFYAKKPSPEDKMAAQVPMRETESFFRPFMDNFSAYKPMYFLVGVDPGKEMSSFQLSFKYRFFNEDGFLAQKAPWITGFHLGYTQKSLWDLDSDSKPFDDTSYMPELFYLADIDLNIPWIKVFGIQAGYQHESNGQEGAVSRSTNFAYIQAIIGFHLGSDYYLKFAPKIWAYADNDNDTNEDLEDYRGYYDLEAKVGSPDGLILAGNFRNADAGSTYQLDLSYPLSQLFGGSLNLYIHAQYFNGYAETLLNYNEKHDAFRLGFSVVR